MINKDDLNELIWDVTDMGYRVTRINNLLSEMEEGKAKTKYIQQYLDLMDQYTKMVDYLLLELEDYVDYEKRNNLPIDLEYRKLLKSLKT